MTTLGEKLREALDKGTLDAWDKHEEQIRKPQKEKQVNTKVRVINNVMRTTFDEVKYAPNMQIADYIESLMARGFKKSSVTSVLYQLLRVGQIKRGEDGTLTVVQPEYTPLNNKRAKKKPEPKRKIVVVTRGKPKPAQGIAALKADTVVKAEGAPFEFAKPKAFIPSQIVDQLTVLHARELYDYLKKIFGG
jgi:hypothetical protein